MTERSVVEIIDWVTARLAVELKVQAGEIDVTKPLPSYDLDSVTIFSIAGDMAQWLDRDLPATIFWDYTTIEDLAAGLAAQPLYPKEFTRPAMSVALRPSGSLPPLFLVKGAPIYRNLARRLGDEQPVYGLIHADNNHGFWDDPEKLAAMCRLYVDEMRSVQKEGPYHIAGLSRGGFEAFLMACELKRQGQQTAFLALFDSYGPNYYVMPRRERVATHLKAWKQLPVKGKQQYVRDRVVFRLTGSRGAATEKATTLAQTRSPFKRQGIEIRAKFADYMRRHREDLFYDGKLLQFIAQENKEEFLSQDGTLGWKNFARDLEVHTTPGTHLTMLQEPQVQQLVSVLVPRLTHAREKSLKKS